MTNEASEALAKLREQYQGQLDERLASIREIFLHLDPATWQPEEAATLHRLVHSLTGSAGTFGLMSVSDLSRKLENALSGILASEQPPDAESWQAVARALDHLERSSRIRLSSNAPELAQQPELLPQPVRAPLIHVIEDDQVQAEFLKQSLLEHGFRVRHFADPADFSAVITSRLDESPAAIVMDMMFPEGDAAGAATVATLGLGAQTGIPVVFVSVRDELAAHLAAYRAGATCYLVKPVDPGQLCGLLDDLTGRMPPNPFRALLVDDDSTVLAYHAAVLRQAGLEVLTVSQPLTTLAALERFMPDVVVLDVYMPDASGPELAAVIREQDRHMNLPILFLSAEADMTKQLLALNLGGDDFLVKPVQPEHLVSAVTARARRARQNTETMRRLSITLYEREREHLALDQHALVSISDAKGLITYANESFCKVSGYLLEEMLGKNHNLIKSGLHPASFYHDMWTTLKSGNIWRGEICNCKKDGSLYWVNATITPFLDGDGKVYQYVSIRTDITTLKQSQETLRTAKERLRRSQIYANIGTWDWSIETGELFWSERIAPLFGYPEGELETSYENFLGAVHPDDRQAVIDAVNACVEHDTPYEIEHRVVWPDGQVRWLLERGAVVRDAAGKAVQMLGVVQDISERKRAQTELAESEQKLADSNLMLQLVLDNIPVRVFWKDTELRYLGCNRAFARDAGREEPDEVIGLDDLSMPWSPEAELYRQDDRKLMASREPKFEYEEAQTTPSGALLWLSTSKVPLFDARDQLIGVLGAYTDITLRKQAEQGIVAAREEAERANRAKSEFLSSMSHELRTPMNAILGFAQILEYDSTLNAEQKGDVEEILKAGRHLLDLINEVLDLAKVESGRVDLSMEGVGVSALGEDCRQLIQPLAAQRGITLHFDLSEYVIVFADRQRLKQVLLNLLSNAVKYNCENGEIHLTALASNDNGRLRIAVRDTGPGIPAARFKDLFQPFNRLDAEHSEIEGSGIGLTISRRLIELMGGEIGLDSELGVGSTFWLELPLISAVKVGVTEENSRWNGGMAEVETDEQRAACVLSVDDNPTNLKLIAQVLGQRPNLRLLTAHTPSLGIDLARAHRPDLILLDINMPGMDGYQVLAIFKADTRLQNTPVVALTANAMPLDIKRGMAAGFTDYLTKPFDLAKLFSTIDRCLSESRQFHG